MLHWFQGGLIDRFPSLCCFVGGIASVYPGTSRVESDFSVLKWEKNDYQKSLMDIYLELIMHSKQVKELSGLNSS